MTMSDVAAQVERLGQYNSGPIGPANPLGLAADGHQTNFPAALADLSDVAQEIGLTAEAILADNSASRPRFQAAVSADILVPMDQWWAVAFGTVDHASIGCFTPATGQFIATKSGVFRFTADVVFKVHAASVLNAGKPNEKVAPDPAFARFYKNGVALVRPEARHFSGWGDTVWGLQLETLITLAQGDTVDCRVFYAGHPGMIQAGVSSFSGQWVP
jgi:hypothetical protein